MSLTISHGPLAAKDSGQVNYRVEGPAHRLFFDPFPRRVRAVFANEIVLDTRRGMLLHESGLLPQLYVPWEDMTRSLLERSDHRTHCPFKGDASYWSLVVGERRAVNAVWAYEEPLPEASWLLGYAGPYWESMDAWFDEDEEVAGHLRDPYHRVDVRRSSSHVRVTVDGEVVAETRRPMVLSETGLPNRYYIPLQHVRAELLEPSANHSVCPYKGTASFRSLRLPSGRRIVDAAWFYPQPLDGVRGIRGHLCFLGEGIETRVDGTPAS